MTGKRGHVLEVTDGSTHLDRGPVAGLALFAHDDLGELILTGLDACGNLQQIACALDGWGLGPSLLGGTCSVECTVHILNGAFRLTADNFLR